METKQDFRLSVQKDFKSYAPATLEEHNNSILDAVRSLPEFNEAQTVLFYCPLPDEVDIMPIIKESISQGRNVCFPLCKPPSHKLFIKSVGSIGTQLVAGTYGILEPDPSCSSVPAADLDCIITPGRAFDRNGNRVGRGAGYYDSLLRETDGFSIAPCFSFQLFEHVPADEADMPVNILVTEDEIIHCSSGI
jgi:5-formyltetrahydrofolate cyclo-ligase